MTEETELARQLREAIAFSKTIGRIQRNFDELEAENEADDVDFPYSPEYVARARAALLDKPETIGSAAEPDEPVDVHYSHDVFLLWDAIAKLARCRYVVRNRRGLMVDTNMICDGDVIVFDRKKWQRMGGGR